MTTSPENLPGRRPATRLIAVCLVALLALALFPACLAGGTTATPVAAPTSQAVPTNTPAPATPEARATPEALTRAVPQGQEVDLPEVDLTYQIDATLDDFDAGRIDAVSLVRVTSREDVALPRLFFRAAPAYADQFALHGVERDGSPVDPVVSDGGVTLEIPLDPALQPGDSTGLRFAFTLTIRDTSRDHHSTTRDGPVLRLGYWYPMLSNAAGYPPLLDPPYTRVADYLVTFTAPPDVVVAAPAAPDARESTAGAGVRYDYTLDHARDFALMMSRDYEVEHRTTSSGVQVNLYTVPSLYGNRDDGAQTIQRDRAFRAAAHALSEYSSRIGPYPWTSLTIVEGGENLGGGIEYTALTAIDFDSSTIDNLVAHEVAHMWFYAVIGTRTQDDPWIDEGAATFLADGVTSAYGSLNPDGDVRYVAPLNASVYDLAAFSTRQWITAVYAQGGVFYADVYRAMGPDAFWAAMQEIYTTQAFEIATPWEVLSIFQQHSPSDLRPLFERYFTYGWIGELG